MDYKTQEKLVTRAFRSMGFKCIGFKHPHAHGPDCWAVGKNKSLSVEIKVARKSSKRGLMVCPVKRHRRSDDVIAIVIGRYVLIECMKDHLALCSKSGARAISKLMDQ